MTSAVRERRMVQTDQKATVTLNNRAEQKRTASRNVPKLVDGPREQKSTPGSGPVRQGSVPNKVAGESVGVLRMVK